MSAADTVISVKDVSKTFLLPHERAMSIKNVFTELPFLRRSKNKESQQALKDISFEVKRGEFFGIVGRNGSGKSTLLKILATIYQPTEGSIELKGRVVPFIELGVGFNPELTGKENVYLNGAMLGFTKKEVDNLYPNIVEFAELEKFMDQKLKNYSSGMQVRLAFSLATRAQADILLVDEVLAVGDADFQRKCFDYFRTLKKNNKTVVFVSHDMNAVREYCDRAILIEKSRILVRGKTSNVATAYTRLFTDTKYGKKATNTRWGNKSVVINRPSAEEVKEKIIIKAQITAKKRVNKPVIGFAFKNATGNTIVGSNTKLLSKDLYGIGDMQPGDTKTVIFEMDNIFNDGSYTVDLAVTDSDGITVYDWWEDSCQTQIFKEIKTPYIVNPDIEFRYKDKDAK